MSAPRKIDIRTPHFFARIATTCTVQYLTPSSGFVSSACQRINLAALGPDLEEGGNVVVSLVFVPRADDACFVPGDYADTHANGLGARKDAGGGRGALVYVVSIRALAFVIFLVLHLQITSTF